MEQFISIIKSLLEPTGVIILLVFLLLLNSWIFNRIKSAQSNGSIVRKSISLLIVFIGIIVFILALPIDKNLKGTILSFLGIIISAGIALSSTTILGNLIAGFMNNSMKRFRNGDLIHIGELQGRVTRISVFHTEIQLEDSNFVTIPNLYIASNPVKLTRQNNTVISTSVSLGYDVSRTLIEEALKEAAIATGLADPYVYITELGDYSVVYKIHGFLEDSGKFFSTGSLLNGKVMDMLHEKGIEIVSPSFMNQRKVEKKMFIPEHRLKENKVVDEIAPEELIFDEAIKSGEIQKKKDILKRLNEKKLSMKERLKGTRGSEEAEEIKAYIARIDKLKEKIELSIKEQSD
ncbi:MAG: mechanosensitive ion channel [Bacteroidales bacterium]|nr:mechanosensitive ion channel [Bacteroidales bacterium]MBN2699065.1 mechanosensitive ion channel [Bacteroidales bacterium]